MVCVCVCVVCAIALTLHHVKSSNAVVQSHRTVHTIKTKLQEIMKGLWWMVSGGCMEKREVHVHVHVRYHRVLQPIPHLPPEKELRVFVSSMLTFFNIAMFVVTLILEL